jgi:hypothetical protein
MAVGLGGCGRGPFWEFPEVVRCSSVDFVYVIDNSDSMTEHQMNLTASFGPFIEGMRGTLDDVDDYHVGVLTTDAYDPNPSGCATLGALVTHTEGPDEEARACGPYAEGKPYMTQADDLEETFECAASVGTSGSIRERPMDALLAGIDRSQWWYPQCNADFVRDDALLVAVIITDEWDGPDDPNEDNDARTIDKSSGTPQDWYDTVVDIKGDPGNAVVVSLVSEAGTGCDRRNPQFDGRHIAEFTRMFPHGWVGGICEPDYGETFSHAVEEIDAACDSYKLVVP